jgi:beta-phosphoglucomutase
MLGAVIFDFDGVVADSELLHYRAMNKAFDLYGLSVSKEEHWEKYLGYTDYDNVRAVNRDYHMGWDEATVQELVRHKTRIFDEVAVAEAVIIDGVLSFVDMLRQNGIPIAVCSGATRNDIDLILEGTSLANSFDPVVTADDVKEGKPHPEGFELALRRLNDRGKERISAAQCVVIEDSHWGLQAAKTAGMHTIAVTNTYDAGHLGPYAEMVVKRLDEIEMSDLQGLCG